MTTRIDIRLDTTLHGEHLTARAYVYHDDRLIEGMDLMDEAAIIGACVGDLAIGRAIQFFRAVNRDAEIAFEMTDEAAAVVTEKRGAERLAEFQSTVSFAQLAAA